MVKLLQQVQSKAVRRALTGSDYFAFLFGALSPYYIVLIGRLHFVEILAPAILILWHKRLNLLLIPQLKTIIVLGIIWLFGQIISDLIVGNSINDELRGWSAIVVFIFLVCALAVLLASKTRRIYLLLFGMAAGGLIKQFIEPSIYFSAEPWKFGFGPAVALLAVVAVAWKHESRMRLPRMWLIPIVALGGLSFLLSARSLGAFLILTALVSALVLGPARTQSNTKKSIMRHSIIIILSVSAAFLVVSGYKYAASNGILGIHAEEEYNIDNSGKVGLFIGGRIELIPALHAIIESPIVGHGSWAKDPTLRYRNYLWSLYNLGYKIPISELDFDMQQNLIPAHSTILQAWVWAGIAGAIFWFYILALMVKSGLQVLNTGCQLQIVAIFLLIWRSWDFLFSPFGSDMRFQWAVSIIIFLSVTGAFKRPVSILPRDTTDVE